MHRELEVMQVLRVPPLGKLVVEVGGKRYENLSEMSDEKAKRVMMAAIGELIGFAGNYQALVEAGVAPPLAVPAPPEKSIEQRQAEFLAKLEAERDALKQAPPPKPKLAVLGGAPPLPTDAAPEEAPAKEEASVAEQIDAILQKHVAAVPEMAQRSIRLAEDSAGGILIEVDGKRYQKPGDIPETQIQALIKSAVKEWGA